VLCRLTELVGSVVAPAANGEWPTTCGGVCRERMSRQERPLLEEEFGEERVKLERKKKNPK